MIMDQWLNHLRLFGKAQVSSILATVVDFLLTYLLLQWLDWNYVVCTAAGALSGGAVNCLINHHWTFRHHGASSRQVMLRYSMVWFGSLVLNVLGVWLLTNIFQHFTSLWDLNPSGCVMLSKTLIAVIVAVFWNYLLQKNFVFHVNNK